MISFTEDNTQDNDFRVLRPKESAEPKMSPDGPGKGKRRVLGWSLFGAVIVILLAVLAVSLSRNKSRGQEQEDASEYLYEPVEQETAHTDEIITPLSEITDSDGRAFTEHMTRTVNDIVLDIYIPHGASAELGIGTPDITDKSIVFATQAADIRADNGKIVGAFVLKGEPLAWGLSKKGYCAIIRDTITVGVADNSPLFEEATEKGGYFFRQYPLVSNGRIVENELKGKSIRKAICDRSGEIIVIMTATVESFHDFSQALVDLGVDNAVYLVGSEYSYGFYRDSDGHFSQFAQKIRGGQKYENYIIWRNNTE